MGQFLNNRSLFIRAGGQNPASDPTDYMRKGEYETGLSGRAASSHTHSASQVSDLNTWLSLYLTDVFTDSDNIRLAERGPSYVWESVLKPSGGILSAVDGLYLNTGSGTGQIATAEYVQSLMHAAVTLAASDTIDASLNAQELDIEVRLAPDGGLEVNGDGSGVQVSFGTGANQASRGNHTHAQLHDAVTVADSSTVDLTLTGQQVSGAVKLRPLASLTAVQGRILAASDGLYAELGPSGTQAAPGNHTHANATADASGFMSAENYRKLSNLADLVQVESNVLFQRHDALIPTQYVGGRRRWGQAMQITYIDLTAASPTAQCLLGLEVDGSVVDTITIPAGSNHAECTNFKALTDVFVNADDYVRVICISGTEGITTTAPENEPSRINLTLGVLPAVGVAATVRINAGGSASSPYSADQFGTGGAAVSTTTPCDTSGVTDPGTQSVYTTARRTDSGEQIVYTVTGLARGIDYLVRLHFNQWIYDELEEELFHIRVIGQTTVSTTFFDIIDEAGADNTAAVQEFTVRADSNGQIQVKLEPQAVSAGLSTAYRASICGLEFLPQV
jgi:hypothetical protein